MLWDEPKIFFLERRYFFSIILSEFLKNRVALHRVAGVYDVTAEKDQAELQRICDYYIRSYEELVETL